MDDKSSTPPSLQQEAQEIFDETAKRSGFFRGFMREVWEFAKIILVSLAIVLPVRMFVAQPFIVRGASMEPTYQDGQYLIIDELSFYLRNPQRGEVIVFRYPDNPSQFFIKRIIGLPGETVVIANGGVTIKTADQPEGFALAEEYIAPAIITAPDSTSTLTDGEYFVLGDNRLESSDSRRWGVLEEDFLIGRTLIRLWPVSEIGIVTNQ
jgi:signal peptidase I